MQVYPIPGLVAVVGVNNQGTLVLPLSNSYASVGKGVGRGNVAQRIGGQIDVLGRAIVLKAQDVLIVLDVDRPHERDIRGPAVSVD